MLSRHRCQPIGLLFLSLLALTCSTGCPVVSNLPAPGRLLTEQVADTHRTYYLYVPSNYRADRPWPLVITCHGTNPFDSARLQLDEWKGLAEKEGCLLAAPVLVGTAGVPRAVNDQITRQAEDEQTILSLLRIIRSAYSIDDSRVFLTGWSAGGYAILYTGLRHPDIFRALAISQGNFRPEYFDACLPFLDPHQPILVTYGNTDLLLKDEAKTCIDWLRSHDLNPTSMERPGPHHRDPQPLFNFFREVIRRHPMIRIRVQDDPLDDMQIGFSVKASFEPARFRWDFGDGAASPAAAPKHRYTKPGPYTVRVAVWPHQGAYEVRHIPVRVPRIRIGASTTPATGNE